jgi:putative transposase
VNWVRDTDRANYNGSDFTSNRLGNVAVDLKIRQVLSIPGKPQGHGRVERFFRTINEMFLCDLQAYTRKRAQKTASKAATA